MDFHHFIHSINRNIVECKGVYTLFSPAPELVLIETLWNVKCVKSKSETGTDIVLIETLWNVKISPCCSDSSLPSVLIETLWNVKTAIPNIAVNK